MQLLKFRYIDWDILIAGYVNLNLNLQTQTNFLHRAEFPIFLSVLPLYKLILYSPTFPFLLFSPLSKLFSKRSELFVRCSDARALRWLREDLRRYLDECKTSLQYLMQSRTPGRLRWVTDPSLSHLRPPKSPSHVTNPQDTAGVIPRREVPSMFCLSLCGALGQGRDLAGAGWEGNVVGLWVWWVNGYGVGGKMGCWKKIKMCNWW